MAYYTRGCAQTELGEPQREVEDFGRAIALDPDNIESLRNRAILNRSLGELDKAVQDYDEIIHLEPDDPSVRSDRQLAVEQAEAAGR